MRKVDYVIGGILFGAPIVGTVALFVAFVAHVFGL